MKKTMIALAAVATLAAGSMAPQQAEARGGRVAAGVIGGLAAGAIIGGALAGPRYYGPGYGAYGAYDAGPPCRIQRQRVWDGFAWRIQRVEVCY